MKYPNLFAQGQIGSLKIGNRVVMVAMETVMAEFDGKPSDLTINYYHERARGGVGLIITGATRVNEWHGVVTPRQLSMAHDSNIAPMKRLTDKIHETETKIFCQIHHPGRQNYSAMMYAWPAMTFIARVVPGFDKMFGSLVKFYAWVMDNVYAPAVKAPSEVPCKHLNQKTKPFSTKEVKAIVKDFVDAAVRCQKSGFDGVEIHGTHGYLVQQFLSTRTNKRTDEYGGSFENRFRFLKEILCGIKERCGADYPVSVRLSIDEFYDESEGEERGITLSEGVKYAQEVERWGADAIDVSSGTYETINSWLEPVSYAPGWRKYLAAEVKKHVSIPVIAANLIRSPQQADAQIAEGSQDFAGLGRPLLCDPLWVKKVSEGREEEIRTCINCLHCFETVLRNSWLAKPLECARNPLLGREVEYEKIPLDSEGKTAVVVGAGVAGMTAATVLARRGFKVTVFEKDARAGGQVNLAQLAPLKLRIAECVDEIEGQAKSAGAAFRYGEEANLTVIEEIAPDTIVCATGSRPFIPPIPGKDAEHVYSIEEILNGQTELEDKRIVVVGSGLTGLETAEYLAEKNNKMTVVEMLDSIGPTAYQQNRDDVVSKLQNHDTQFMTSIRLEQINDDSVLLRNMKNQEQLRLEADAVVLALGNRGDRALYDELVVYFDDVRLAGDAEAPGKIADAVREGFQAALL